MYIYMNEDRRGHFQTQNLIFKMSRNRKNQITFIQNYYINRKYTSAEEESHPINKCEAEEVYNKTL